jgi:hypothetical protein
MAKRKIDLRKVVEEEIKEEVQEVIEPPFCPPNVYPDYEESYHRDPLAQYRLWDAVNNRIQKFGLEATQRLMPHVDLSKYVSNGKFSPNRK